MEKIAKLIDVVVPVYNVEQYVRQCIESLLEQTLPVGIIIVDDGSKDQSSIIVEELRDNFPNRIQLIKQENAGLSSARNTGLKAVKAEYVAFMDSDDWVSSNYYEALYEKIIEQDAEISCADITYAYKDKFELKPSNTLSTTEKAEGVSFNDASFVRNIIDIFPMIQNKLWKTSFIRDNNLSFLSGKLYEDLDFFYRSYPKVKKIVFTTKGTFYYRQRSGSIVKQGNPRVFEISGIFSHIIQCYKEEGHFEQFQMEIEYLLIRNCLVASSKRLAYSGKYSFIKEYLTKLFNYVKEMVPNWRKNTYLDFLTIRHIYIKTFHNVTIPFHAFSLVIIGKMMTNKNDF